MNSGNNIPCFHIVLAIWIIAVVPLGFSESFQNRPTGSDMDNAVALGTECVLGVNERCLATQLNPPFVKTNAAIGWYLDQNMMGQMDSTIRSRVPYFVDTDTVYDGTTNIAMLTVTGIVTYGDCPWRIYTSDLIERYKAIWAEQQTMVVATRPWIEKWSGMGRGLTLADAYTAASTNYKFQTNGYLPGLTFEQTCISTFWSNYDSSVATNYPYGTVLGSNYVQYTIGTDLIVTLSSNVIPGYWTNIWPAGDTNIWPAGDTNRFTIGPIALVANCVLDNESGLVWLRNANSGYMNWTDATAYCAGLDGSSGRGYTGWRLPTEAEWEAFVDTTYTDPTVCNTAGTGQWAEGDPFTGVLYGMYDFYWSSTESGEGDAIRMWLSPGSTTSGDKTFSLPVWPVYGGAMWVPPSSGPDPSGTYVGTSPSWTGPNGWYVVYNGGSNTYYITQNTDSLSPSWSLSGTGPTGIYSTINGTGITGTAYVVTNDVTGWHWMDIPYKPTWVSGSGTNTVTNTVFYQCWLYKTVCTNDSYSITNIEHRIGYWVHPSKSGAGGISANYFDDEGLGLTEDSWNDEGGLGDWTWATNSPVFFGGNIATPPATTTAPASPNTSTCTGFVLGTSKAIVEWVWLHCANKFW